ncbi:signal peptidase I [uncultured Oscillibacter sp.]|uniref:signal peptidase I n=1 Tax=uncultured Oscillibacter sp. TaxID=876091 RepID=UPI0025CE2BE2|nr:signal peptidase I [uncultured Oscillibacter sp.]
MEEKRQSARELYSWLRTLVCVVVGAILIFTFVVRLVRVDGESMRETLQDGDVLVAVSRYLAGEVEPGDIVVIRDAYFEDGQPIVKRVIATAGQTVDIDFDAGIVYVDGQALDEPYTREPTYLEEGTEFPLTVPENELFLLGDNRNDSEDSRSAALGTVDEQCLLGKVVLLLFPGKSADTQQRDFGRIGGV